jgi:hypothetical protein
LEKIAKAKPELLCLTDEELGNSLHYASSICFLEGVRFLLKNFLNGAYKTNSEGNYPIHVACKYESVDLVKEFLDIFPYPKEFLNKKGQNILHVAAENGQGNVVRYILGNDQKIVEPLLNEMDEDGNTPLHLAARQGQSRAAFVLVRDKRVENLIVNNENFTPYDVAKQQSKMAVDQYNKTDEMVCYLIIIYRGYKSTYFKSIIYLIFWFLGFLFVASLLRNESSLIQRTVFLRTRSRYESSVEKQCCYILSRQGFHFTKGYHILHNKG